jgi:AcrR family transcriptional regulator
MSPSASTPLPIHHRRDAERNHEAIVTAAIAVLADAPEAAMAEIASASGIGRSTLYRHFPDRAALVEAIYQRVFGEAGEIIDRRLDEGADEDPVEVLVDVVAQLAALRDRYRFLINHQDHLKKPDDRRGRRTPLRQFIVRAQTAGSLRDDLGADWLALVVGQLIAGAARHEFPDAAARRVAVERTVRSLLTPAP